MKVWEVNAGIKVAAMTANKAVLQANAAFRRGEVHEFTVKNPETGIKQVIDVNTIDILKNGGLDATITPKQRKEMLVKELIRTAKAWAADPISQHAALMEVIAALQLQE